MSEPQVRPQGQRKRRRKWMRTVLPERQILIRTQGRLRHVVVGSAAQFWMIAAVVIMFGWATFTSAMFVFHNDVMAAKRHEVREARSAYIRLLTDVSAFRNRMMTAADALEESYGRSLDALVDAAELRKQVEAVHGRFANADERSLVQGTRIELTARLKQIRDRYRQLGKPGDDGLLATVELAGLADTMTETRMHALRERERLRAELVAVGAMLDDIEQRQSWAKIGVGATHVELRETRVNLMLAEEERDGLRDRVAALETLVADMQNAQIGLLAHVSDLADERIAELEQVLSQTDLDIDKLLSIGNDVSHQGGPFVPAGELPDLGHEALNEKLGSIHEKVLRWEDLITVVDASPLGRPLEGGWVSSGYGVRKDPFTGQRARHLGMDFGHRTGQPVVTTARGVISYAGARHRYGNMVEVDHGRGFKTRYAHLSKINVKKGDRVASGDTIGLVGNTGRSTGPHLHYEIRIDDRPVNPYRFVKAKKHVF